MSLTHAPYQDRGRATMRRPSAILPGTDPAGVCDRSANVLARRDGEPSTEAPSTGPRPNEDRRREALGKECHHDGSVYRELAVTFGP